MGPRPQTHDRPIGVTVAAVAAGFAGGLVANWVYGRVALRYAAKTLGRRESHLRKRLLAKLDYDGLLVFQRAVETELGRRRPSEPRPLLDDGSGSRGVRV